MFDFQMVSKLYSRQKLNTNVSVLVDPNQPIFESSLFSIFKINLIQLVKNKVGLVKNFYLQPSEIERMPYWEYELMLDAVNDNIKEEKKRNDEENSKYDFNSMKKQASSMMPKMPSGHGHPKMPSMPKF